MTVRNVNNVQQTWFLERVLRSHSDNATYSHTQTHKQVIHIILLPSKDTIWRWHHHTVFRFLALQREVQQTPLQTTVIPTAVLCHATKYSPQTCIPYIVQSKCNSCNRYAADICVPLTSFTQTRNNVKFNEVRLAVFLGTFQIPSVNFILCNNHPTILHI